MTREEAVKWLKDYIQNTPFQMEQYEKAFDMAIKALSQEPCELLILKSDILLHQDDRKKWMESIKREKENGVIILPPYFEPLLVPADIEINIEQEPCDDTVSIRKDVLKYRVGKLVVYNVEWLKKHWQMEMDIVCGVKPCEDAISRKDMTIEGAIDITKEIDKFWITDKEAKALDIVISKAEELSCIYDLKNRYCPRLDEHGFFKHTSVTPKPTECDDAISRDAVLDALLDYWHNIQFVDGSGYDVYEDCKAVIDELPSVTQKSGKWIEMDGYDGDVYYDCSECGESWTTIEGTPWNNGMKFCPNCGAKMVEPQESEDK